MLAKLGGILVVAFVFGTGASGQPAQPAPGQAGSACPDFYYQGQEPVLTTPRPDSPRIFCHSFYSVAYSTTLRDPLWSAEHLTREMAIGGDHTKRVKSIKFAPQPELTRDEQGSHYDYVRPYDRGHMTPANDAIDVPTQRDTFVVTNIVPQQAKLNERLWQYLEASVHQLAEEDGEVYVVTGPIFAARPPMMKKRIAIPAYTFKAIYDPRRNAAVAFIADNSPDPVCRVVSISELTEKAGIDPFPTLAPQQKEQVPELTLPKGPTVPLADCRPG